MENTNYINLIIQDHTGDRRLRLQWSTSKDVVKSGKNPELIKKEQEQIQNMFVDLQNAGYRFFSVKKILGFIPKKGKEVKKYDPELGELIYEKPESTETTSETKLKIQEVEAQEKTKYEEPKKFEPEKESVDTSRDYVATKPMRAG